ncbi:hypothetical protein AVEN_255835-1 [Araneus ventricosus]|uniref:Uncharacterized protein n=1 Tax=Araneus ventricosus TaxID=182803 RepID=A0A4Y2EMR8_ARAVE|nr:hypothetical protein AVEN_255835-1 [Araneus ventricosus]
MYKMATMQEKDFFIEQAVTGSVYLDMLQLWSFPQLTTDSLAFIFQQDGASPHWSTIVRDFLNRELPHRWIGRAGLDEVPLSPWPPDRQISSHVISSCGVM